MLPRQKIGGNSSRLTDSLYSLCFRYYKKKFCGCKFTYNMEVSVFYYIISLTSSRTISNCSEIVRYELSISTASSAFTNGESSL